MKGVNFEKQPITSARWLRRAGANGPVARDHKFISRYLHSDVHKFVIQNSWWSLHGIDFNGISRDDTLAYDKHWFIGWPRALYFLSTDRNTGLGPWNEISYGKLFCFHRSASIGVGRSFRRFPSAYCTVIRFLI